MTTRAAFTNCSWITGNTEVAGAMPTYQTSPPQPNVPKQARHRLADAYLSAEIVLLQQRWNRVPIWEMKLKRFPIVHTPVDNLNSQSLMGALRQFVVDPCIGYHFKASVAPAQSSARETDAAASSLLHGVLALQRYRPAAPDCSHQRASASRLQQSLGVCHGPPTRRT